MSRVIVCDGEGVNAYPFDHNAHWRPETCSVALIEPTLVAQQLFAGAFRLHHDLQHILAGTLALRGLTMLSQPLAGSPGSAAFYWVEHAFPDKGSLLLLQYLPRSSATSVHWHREEREVFTPVGGMCTVVEGPQPAGGQHATQSGSVDLNADDPHYLRQWTVDRGVVHQLVTHESPALNLILITHTKAGCLKELNHCYTTWCQGE